MNTPPKIAANRANAQRSTGPRTTAGKARSSRNAVRYGLNVASGDDPGVAAEVADLARLFEGRGGAPTSAAQRAAEAQAHLLRIQMIKRQVVQIAARRIAASAAPSQPQSADEIQAQAVIESADELLKLDEYERKARSRRKKALRALWE